MGVLIGVKVDSFLLNTMCGPLLFRKVLGLLDFNKASEAYPQAIALHLSTCKQGVWLGFFHRVSFGVVEAKFLRPLGKRFYVDTACNSSLTQPRKSNHPKG